MSLRAQEPLPAPLMKCPTISIECPSDGTSYDLNHPLTFTAEVSEADSQAKLTFNWTISSGTIYRGQGTPAITVSGFGDSITATVEVQGLPEGCSNKASCSTIWCPAPLSHIFDQYVNLAFRDEKARLDNFAVELGNNPSAQAYLIAYRGKNNHQNRTQSRLNQAKTYLMKRHNIEDGRIITIDGGQRDESLMELWIVPTGAEPPKPTPSN